MSNEARRLLIWVGVSWLAVFLLAVGMCLAHDLVSIRASNIFLAVCLTSVVATILEFKRGWAGLGISVASGLSAFCLGSSVGLECLRLGLHSTKWLHGVERATVIGAAALLALLAQLIFLARRTPHESPVVGEPRTAREALAHIEMLERGQNVECDRLKVNHTIHNLVAGVFLTVTLTLGSWKFLSVSFWVAIWPVGCLSIGLVAASQKLRQLLTNRLTRSTREFLAEGEEFRQQMIERLRERAADEEREQN